MTVTIFAVVSTDVRRRMFAPNLFFNLFQMLVRAIKKIRQNNLQTSDGVDDAGPLLLYQARENIDDAKRLTTTMITTESLTFCWSRVWGCKTKINPLCQNSDAWRLWRKTFPRMSDESRKTPALFSDWPRKKHPPAGLFLIIYPPQPPHLPERDCDPPPPSPTVVFFPASAAANTTWGGSTNLMLWKNSSDSLLTFHCSLLDVCSFLNVTAQTECDEQNENNLKKKKTQEKMSQRPGVAEEFTASLEKTYSSEL